MADIFSVSPPAWLVDIAKPIDTKQTGEALGTVVGGLFNAFRTGSSNAKRIDAQGGNGSTIMESLKAIPEGMHRSWMNNRDPMWELKAQGIQNAQLMEQRRLDLTSKTLDLNARKIQADMTNDDNQARWMAEDIAKIEAYMKIPREQRITAERPVMRSSAGSQQLNGIISDDERWFQWNYDKRAVKEWDDDVIKLTTLADELKDPTLKDLASRMVGRMGKQPTPLERSQLASALSQAEETKYQANLKELRADPNLEEVYYIDEKNQRRSRFQPKSPAKATPMSESDKTLMDSDTATLKELKKAIALTTKEAEKVPLRQQIAYYEKKIKSYETKEAVAEPPPAVEPPGWWSRHFGSASETPAPTEVPWTGSTTNGNKWRVVQ